MALQSLDIARELAATGMDRSQAEAVGTAIVRIAEERDGDAATGADLERVEHDLTAEIMSVRSDLTAEIASVRSDLTAEIASVRSNLTTEIASVRSEVLLALERQRTQLILSIGAIVALITAIERLLFT